VNQASAEPGFAVLLRRTGLALTLAIPLLMVCYYFVDRPVADYVQARRINHIEVLRWLTLPPPILQSWAPALLTLLAVRRAWGPYRRWELTLFTAAIALVLADQFKQSVDFVFGRSWPDTWIHDNPSWIRDGAYGFHWLQGGNPDGWYDSFPSGHTARVLGAAAVYWISYPGWRALGALAAILIAGGLIGMNYHFVSDVLAGGLLGGGVGVWAAWYAGLADNARAAARSGDLS